MNSFLKQEEVEKIGFKAVGKNVLISRKASIYSPEKISIGNNVRIDDFCILSGNITLGNFIHIAAYCGFFSGNEGIEINDFCTTSSKVSIYAISDDYSGEYLTNPTVSIEYRNVEGGKVILGKHVIVGSGSVILPNLILREGTSIGAMSLVNQSTQEWYIYAGIPIKKIKERKKNLLHLEKKFMGEEGLK